MEKGINLQAQLHLGSDQASASSLTNVTEALPAAFAKANPGLQLSVKHVTPVDAAGNATVRVYIQGEQDPAADFAALTRSALNKAIAEMNAITASTHGSGSTVPDGGAGKRYPSVRAHNIQEVEVADDDGGLVLAPKAQSATSTSGAMASDVSSSKTGTGARATSAPTPATQPPAPSQPTTQATAPADPNAQPTSTAPIARAPWWAIWRRGKQ